MNKENKNGWKPKNSYLKLPDSLYTKVNPVRVDSPELQIFNYALASELGFNFNNTSSDFLAEIFSGNQLAEGSQPIALAYAGHQFGYFTMLGDGRAILLGEQISPDNERFDIQLKGSGRTPYSRNGDGRATLSSMLREYLISEAMHHLGIPTTRSLAVVKSGEMVIREQKQDGAILTRIAQSHLRIGSFEFAAAIQNDKTLKLLCDYAINRHYPEVKQSENPPLTFFKTVMQQQISLIINWMRVGFIHGVMNTDNISISGETIDYGPCAFLNSYDPATVYSSIDQYGRYAYGNQPAILHWNLSRLATALVPITDKDEKKAIDTLNEVLQEFQSLYKSSWLKMMRSKLGFFTAKSEDEALINGLLQWMKNNQADYTNTFLRIQSVSVPDEMLYQKDSFINWLQQWQQRIAKETHTMEKHKQLMSENNPVYIPRNHLVEAALKSATDENDYTLFHRLSEVLAHPYTYHSDYEAYQKLPSSAFESRYQTFCGT
jgi:uncharacterized protein YdiU (UPF0061 family)